MSDLLVGPAIAGPRYPSWNGPHTETPAGWAHDQRDARITQLRQLPIRVRMLLAAEWARGVLPIFERKRPGDDRPRKAIEAAEAWAYDPCERTKSAASDAATAAYAAAAAYAADSYAAAAAYAADATTAADAYAAYAADAADAAATAAAAYSAYAADAADAATTAAAAAAYAATAAYADDSYAASAAYAAATAASKKKWLWLYATFRHASGPVGVPFNPRWKTETVVALARGIVAGRAFDRMPILADALEEAGSDLGDDLLRLRSGGDEFTAADWCLTSPLGLWET